MSAADELLQTIAHCPIVERCLTSPQLAHPCAQIVRSQGVRTLAEFHVPEPWNGDIGRAPILFLSSNPSIGPAELYPRWSWPPEQTADYFTHRFGGGQRAWTRDGIKSLQADGTYGARVRYWAAIRTLAAELLGRDRPSTSPGVDHALSEIVHCKSRGNLGVAEAAVECVPRYLGRVLDASGAKVVICVGADVRRALLERFGWPAGEPVIGPLELEGRPRLVAFIPHPNAQGGAKTIAAACGPAGLRRMQAFLAGR